MQVIILDAKNILFRYGWTARNLSHEGKPTGAIYGCIMALMGLKRRYPDGRFLAVWDGVGARSNGWRRRYFAGYKARRDEKDHAQPMPNGTGEPTRQQKEQRQTKQSLLDIRAQEPRVKQLMQHLQIPQVEVPGVEGDDMMAIMAFAVKHRGWEPVVFSSDKDFLQLGSHDIKIITDSKDTERLQAKTRRLFGCDPADVLSYRSLVGDQSDDIPNAVDGIGPKRALKLLQAGANPALKTFEEHPETVQRDIKVLEADWGAVHRNYILMRLPSSPDTLRFTLKQRELARRAVTKSISQLAMKTCKARDLYDEFVGWLGDSGLTTALEQRHTLWSLQDSRHVEER